MDAVPQNGMCWRATCITRAGRGRGRWARRWARPDRHRRLRFAFLPCRRTLRPERAADGALAAAPRPARRRAVLRRSRWRRRRKRRASDKNGLFSICWMLAMKITQKAVRVYESRAYVATSPDQELPNAPITLEPITLDSGGTPVRSVYLGEIPQWILDARQIRQALGYLFLNWFRGISITLDSDSAIADALTQIQPMPHDDAWYVTVVVAQDFDVPDETINDNQYVWFVDDTFGRADSFQMVASPYIDRLALLASTVMTSDAIGKIIILDHVYFTAPGKKAFGLPVGDGRLTVSKPLSALNIAGLENRLRCGSTLTQDAISWLAIVTPWWLARIQEADPWKAFIQLFTGLELLHNRLAKRYYDHAMKCDRVRMSDLATRKGTPILAALLYNNDPNKDPMKLRSRRDLFWRGEFAVTALALFPQVADADFAAVARIKDLRDNVAHGKITLAETTFPLGRG